MIFYSLDNLLVLLLKDKGIHEGYWSIAAKFGFTATNINTNLSDNKGTHFYPGAIIPLIEVGLQEHEQPSQITVNASRVNPKSGKAKLPKASPVGGPAKKKRSK